jgi:hypothetical protein
VVSVNGHMGSLESQQHGAKDRRERSPVPPLAPSEALLSSFVGSRRPVYRPAPGIAVPRLEQVPAEGGLQVVPPSLHEYRQLSDRELVRRRRRETLPVLHPRVYQWLDHIRSGERPIDFNRDERSELKALTAAVLRDVAGFSPPSIEEWVDTTTLADNSRRIELMAGTSNSRYGDRVVRDLVRRGRELWVQLAAWPWWPIAQSGKSVVGGLPESFWELRDVVETHALWVRLEPDGSLKTG